MKKFFVILFSVLTLNACGKVEDKVNDTKNIRQDLVTNSFAYSDLEGDESRVTEFTTTTGKDCTVIQTHYGYDKAKSTLSCKIKDVVLQSNDLGKVNVQYFIMIEDDKAQVTEFVTKTSKDCTVIQTHYGYDNVQSSMSCS